MSGASVVGNRHASEQVVGTPIEFILAVEARFGPLAFDLAATSKNAKARFFFSKEDDSLSKDWSQVCPGNLWLNPEFADISPWASKCRESAAGPRRFARILMLVPASIGTVWFADHVHGHAMVLGLLGRMRFEGHEDHYPKDLMLCVFGEFRGFDVWDWRAQK